MIKISFTLLALVVLVLTGFLIANSHSMNQMVEKEIAEFISKEKGIKNKKFTYDQIDHLPEPVKRYFKYTLNDGQKHMKYAKIKLEGNLKVPGWKRFSKIAAVQYIRADHPDFIWKADMKINTFVWADIRDSYHDRKGSLFVNIFSGLNVLDLSDVTELNTTMLLRWAGMAVMLPTALLPSDNVQWEGVDENTAKAVITDGNLAGSYLFYFNEMGEIVKYVSNDRYERVDGEFVNAGSIAYRSEYSEFDGIRVPKRFSITRTFPDGRKEEFWKGNILDIQFFY